MRGHGGQVSGALVEDFQGVTVQEIAKLLPYSHDDSDDEENPDDGGAGGDHHDLRLTQLRP